MITNSTHEKPIVLLIIAASLAMFMASLDGTIVNIALPTISEVFGLTTSTVAWVSTIYLLVSAGLLLIVGKISDIVGYKKMFLLGFAIFTFGSFSCGFFPEVFNCFPLLLISRVIQALGGVIMTVIAPAILSSNLSAKALPKGMSIVMLFATIGMALGPTLGGVLTEYISWNWIFYINVPVGIFAIILGIFVLPKDTKTNVTMKGFDGVGAALIFVGMAALLFAISEGSTLGWGSVPILCAIVLTVAGIGGFIIRELRVEQPILDLRLFKNHTFLLINIIFILLFFSFAGINYLMPFYLEHVNGMDTFTAGLVITAMSIGMMVSGVAAGILYGKFVGKIKVLLIVGALLIAAGYFMLTKLSPFSGLGFIITGLSLAGLGLGLATTPLATMIIGSVSEDKKGMVSSLSGLERQAPVAIGVAFFNLMLIVGVKYIANRMDIITTPPSDILAEVLSKGFDLCFFVSFILVLVIVVLCFFVNEKKLHP